ncbi:MAG: hypothetical protein GXP42_16430 [Chloroflexi bacterium]|nr:hypothetical protein [Chloroflexota bacterium]
MPRYIEFQTESGDVIIIEAEEIEAPGVRKAGLGAEELVERAERTFEQALAGLSASAQAITKTLFDIPQPPDAVEVTFGLKLSSELNIFTVAKAGGDATYEVKIAWKREPT